MDDLIVIILTLVIAAFGAFGQIKKKKAIQQGQPAANPPDDIWDIFQQRREQPVQAIESEPEYYEAPESILDKYDSPDYGFDPHREGISAFEDRFSTKKPVLPIKKKKKYDFSLKKAIIYSEILNRKYIWCFLIRSFRTFFN